MARSVRCTQCGATTPLPDDLRTPTFRCGYCAAELRTLDYAGEEAVSADRLMGHIGEVVAGRTDLAAPAPRFVDTNQEMRAASCKRCSAPVEVPLALEVHWLTCGACGVEQPVNEYVSDKERLELDMQRQLAGNQALADLRVEGLVCRSCGGRNDVPNDGSVQLVCRFCGSTILLADYVDEGALARARMKQGIEEMKARMREAQAEELRRNRTIATVLVVLGLGAAIVAKLLGA